MSAGKVSLTARRLLAMEGALTALLAGEVGEGDWPEGVTKDDADSALDWMQQELRSRRRGAPSAV